MIRTHSILFVIVSFLFIGCGSTVTKIGEKEFLFETKHWNFKKRTLFKIKDSKMFDGIYLYDSKGNERLMYPYSDQIDFHEINYRANEEANRPSRSLNSVVQGFEIFGRTMRYDYRQFFDKGEDQIQFTVLAWVNEFGEVEHAVCLENYGAPIHVIYSIITDLENFRFPIEKGTKLGCYKKTYNVHVMHHNEYAH